ncbi:Hypothetical protein A7982_07842 [Minicystis rosea]|nr:Hypothetical protein A7982_07842 [Minicystis rosea]
MLETRGVIETWKSRSLRALAPSHRILTGSHDLGASRR